MGKAVFGTTIPDAADIPIETPASQNSVTPVAESIQDFIDTICPKDLSQKVTYLSNGEVSFIEFFKTSSQITANRTARVDITYSGQDVTKETWKLYDVDGTTILKTIVFDYTYVTNDLDKVTSTTT